MSNRFHAHIFKQRSVGEREEVLLRLFNSDGTPFVMGGVERVYVNGEFDSAILPAEQSPIDWSTMTEGGVITGGEVDADDPTKLWMPPGIYFMTIMYSVAVSGTPTYMLAALSAGYDEGNGVIPDQVSAWAGAGTESSGEAVPYNSQARGDGWGVGSIPFYFQIATAHDAPDPLSGSILLRIARVAAF